MNYRLEIAYQIFPNKGNPYTKNINYIFNSLKPIQNRIDVLNKLESYEHIFELSNKITNHTKLSIIEVIGEKDVKDFTIPKLNLYYSLEEFNTKNDGFLLYGNLLDSFDERMEALTDERELYEKENIEGFETEKIIDIENNEYIVIKNSPINKKDYEIIH